jgi:hypothetical protein
MLVVDHKLVMNLLMGDVTCMDGLMGNVLCTSWLVGNVLCMSWFNGQRFVHELVPWANHVHRIVDGQRSVQELVCGQKSVHEAVDGQSLCAWTGATICATGSDPVTDGGPVGGCCYNVLGQQHDIQHARMLCMCLCADGQ